MNLKSMLMLILTTVFVSCSSARNEAVLKEQLWKLRNRITVLEQKIAARENKLQFLERASGEVRLLLTETKNNLDESKSSATYLKSEVEEIQLKLEKDYGERLSTVERDVLDLNARISSKTPIEKAKQDEKVQKPKLSAKEIHDIARKNFQKKHFKNVIKRLAGFEDYFQSFGSLGEIYYLRAASFYKIKLYQEAALEFNKILENYQSGVFGPISQMRMADCYKKLGDKDTARIYYNEFLKKYKRSKYRKEVKKKLGELK